MLGEHCWWGLGRGSNPGGPCARQVPHCLDSVVPYCLSVLTGFGPHLGMLTGLLLMQCSGVDPDSAWGAPGGARDQTRTFCMDHLRFEPPPRPQGGPVKLSLWPRCGEWMETDGPRSPRSLCLLVRRGPDGSQHAVARAFSWSRFPRWSAEAPGHSSPWPTPSAAGVYFRFPCLSACGARAAPLECDAGHEWHISGHAFHVQPDQGGLTLFP